MRPPSHREQLQATVALGMGELRGAVARRQREIEARAEFARRQAKTKIERERAKAQKEKELADLEREMYEAKLAAIQARARAKRARLAAGVLTPSERLAGALRGTGRVLRGTGTVSAAFYRGLMTPDRPKGRKGKTRVAHPRAAKSSVRPTSKVNKSK